MTVATAVLTVALVPIVSRLLERFSTRTVVTAGFVVSAAGHVVEWVVLRRGPLDRGRHLPAPGRRDRAAAVGLLVAHRRTIRSGGARAAYGRIAAAGTAGGIVGSVVAERIATTRRARTRFCCFWRRCTCCCSGGVAMMRGAPALLPAAADGARSDLESRGNAAHAVRANDRVVRLADDRGLGNHRLPAEVARHGVARHRARTCCASSRCSTAASRCCRSSRRRSPAASCKRLGISGTLNALPAGVGAAGTIALDRSGMAGHRRASSHRSGAARLALPQRLRAAVRADGRTHRATASRPFSTSPAIALGEAAGSGIVQFVLLAGAGVDVEHAAGGGDRPRRCRLADGPAFGRLYLGVVERELVKYQRPPAGQPGVGSGMDAPAGSDVRLVTAETAVRRQRRLPRRHRAAPRWIQQLRALADLRSRDAGAWSRRRSAHPSTLRPNACRADHRPARVGRSAAAARAALEQLAPAHLRHADRRAARSVDGLRHPPPSAANPWHVASARSIGGVVDGLDDSRFEVRYHCSRAIDRILTKSPGLSVDRARIIAVIERELSVPPQLWQGYRLLDRPEAEAAGERESSEDRRGISNTSFRCSRRSSRASRSTPPCTASARRIPASEVWRSSISIRCCRRPSSNGCAS